MTLVPRRYCLECDTALTADGACLKCDACPVTNAAGDVCALAPPHRCPHRTADGRDFGAEQTDSEIAALIRAAFARHAAQPGCLVELESIESAEVQGVEGPGVLLIRVTHRSRLR